MNTNALSDQERRKLKLHESTITNGRKVWQAVGKAIIEIKKLRLYRESFGTFSEYCLASLNMSARQADQFCAGVFVVEKLEAAGENNCSELKESQVRELAKLPEEKIVHVFAAAKESAGGNIPTAKQIKTAAGTLPPPVPPQAPDFGQRLAWLDAKVDDLLQSITCPDDAWALSAELELRAEEINSKYPACTKKIVMSEADRVRISSELNGRCVKAA